MNGKTIVALAGAACMLVTAAGAAMDPAPKCRQAIVRGAAKLAHARLVALRKCEDAKRAGKLPAPTSCRDEAGVAAGFATARTKLAATVAAACGGGDKACAGGDDVALATIGFPATCPDLEGGGCASPLASCADVPACLACLADVAVARGVALAYAPLAVADPQSEKAVVRCQKALTAAATALTDARVAVDARCLTARLKGKHAETCPFPGDGSAGPKLAKVRAKAERAVCKACGGADKQCGGGDDLARELVGSAPACPGVGTCDTAIAGFADVVACFACTSAARADCALAAAAPSVAAYPAGCAVVPPTPTPTVTPTPTLTPSATPTFTPSPTPTATPKFCVRDPARAANVTLSIATGGPLLGAGDLAVAYDPTVLRLDGVFDDEQVRSAVTDLTGGAIVNKGTPNNQDHDGDLAPDRVRLTVVSTTGVSGQLLRIAFGVCAGAATPQAADVACTILGTPLAADGATTLPGATCTLAVANASP